MYRQISMPKFHFSLITFKAHIRQKPKYIYRHKEPSRCYKTSEKSVSNKLFLNGSTLKLIPHSRDTTHNCVVEPSFQTTFVLTCRLYYTHYVSNILHFLPHNTQFYPEKVTNYHPAS